jgi:Leucine-rich repeat (LRR) protein
MHGSLIPVLASFAISFVVVFGGEVPASQVAGLHALFNSTNGVGWHWEPNETAYGVPWDFSNETVDPCIDHWQGISCSSVCDQASVCNIVGLSLAAYSLVGSLPQSVDLLSSLETLDLSSNTLVGQVPSTLGCLVQLQALDLSDNQLSGPVLDSLTSLPRLTSLVIESNCFSGSLPADLFLMSSLKGLYVRNNKIGGTIPESLGQLVSLTGLDLFVNAVGGTLPAALGNLTALAYLDFYTNLMTGSVPASFSSLSSLTFLSFGNNQFTGTVPSYLGAFSSLVVLGVSYNSFQGAMPASFAALQGLKFFSCRDNLMTGDMGFMLALPLLQLYLAGNNFFTGDFGALAPASVSPHLATLRMENNLLTGSALLPGLCADNRLKELVLSQNSLSGSVPPCISSWVNMTTIDLSANKLSGSLPTAFAQLKKLAAADVSTNHLHGQLVALFNDVVVLSVSDNEFTGPLPLNTFNSTRLQTFIASKNCFSGTLSPGICAAASLQTLALSGLMSAANCRVHLPFKRFTIEFFRGGIPPCIFEMPLLEQLFLSGNLIQGKLPELASGSLLHNISLGYNRLSGTIPRSVLTQPFLTVLDLSYNRLLGTIEAMQNSTLDSERQLTLLLQENCLSGNIPDQFHHSDADLNILSGNMFSCANTAELPDSDPKSEKYSCGSNLLNTAVTITGAAWGLIIGIAVWLWFRTKQADGVGDYSFVALMRHLYGQFSKFSPNLDEMDDPEFSLRHNLVVIRNFCLFVSLVTFFVLVVVLPVLTSYSLDPKFSVQTYQYGWVISLSFIQGVSPGITIMVLWVGLVLLCMVYELKCHDRKRPLPPNSPHRSRVGSELSDIDFDERSSSYNEVLLQKILIVSVSVSVSTLINVMYVYTVLYESSDVQTLALSALVVCKLAWMYLVVIPWLKQVNSQFLLILAVMVANVIVIPMIATLTVDDSCFYQYLHNGHAITTEYSYEMCDLYDDDFSCIGYSATSNAVTIAAPIVYSYECFSAMLLNCKFSCRKCRPLFCPRRSSLLCCCVHAVH